MASLSTSIQLYSVIFYLNTSAVSKTKWRILEIILKKPAPAKKTQQLKCFDLTFDRLANIGTAIAVIIITKRLYPLVFKKKNIIGIQLLQLNCLKFQLKVQKRWELYLQNTIHFKRNSIFWLKMFRSRKGPWIPYTPCFYKNIRTQLNVYD